MRHNEGSCAFGKDFLGTHTNTSTDILPIPSCKIHTLHTHGTHGGGSLHGQVRVSFTISSLCCRPG